MKFSGKELKHRFQTDTLFRNSVYLILATAVMSGFGFLFWLLASRFYSSEAIGLATTLISVTSLVSSFSLLGLDGALIHYVPTSTQKNAKINTALAMVGLTSLLVTLIYLVFLPLLTPKLIFVRGNLVYSAILILVTGFYSENILFDGIFTSLRATVYDFMKNAILSFIKFVLPVAFVALGAFGLYLSFGLATIIAVSLSLIILVLKFRFSVKPHLDPQMLKIMAKFSLGNYLAMFLGTLPTLSLPILVTNLLGARYTAFFYIDMMISGFLFIIPLSITQSFFAEGSHQAQQIKTHQLKAIKLIALILLPAIILTVFLGKYVLLAFGPQYALEGERLLQLMALSGLLVSVTYLGDVLLKLRHQLRQLITLKLTGTVIILGLSLALHSHGLIGIGIAWTVGYLVTSLFYVFTRVIY